MDVKGIKAYWELFKVLPFTKSAAEGDLEWALAHIQCINTHSGQCQTPEVKLCT